MALSKEEAFKEAEEKFRKAKLEAKEFNKKYLGVKVAYERAKKKAGHIYRGNAYDDDEMELIKIGIAGEKSRLYSAVANGKFDKWLDDRDDSWAKLEEPIKTLFLTFIKEGN